MSSVRPTYIQGAPLVGDSCCPAGLDGGRRYKVALFMEHPKFLILSNVENNDDTSGVKNPTQNQAFKRANSGNPVQTLSFCPLFYLIIFS
jgi:hypothetical protein